MYDAFSADYDRFVDWPARLAVELPFTERRLQTVGGRRVLDVACGTGRHSIALARRGYLLAGTDLSKGMIERARANAVDAKVDVRFEVAAFGELARTFDLPSTASSGRHGSRFDGLLCLGNSLPHLLTPAELHAALADFAACLHPGGLLLIQNRNFDAVLSRCERWMKPQSCREGKTEWIFLRFYDFELRGRLIFNMVTLRREGAGEWKQQVASTRLHPLRREELTAALEAAEFVDVVCYGDMSGAPFDPGSSGNLIVTARRRNQ